MSFLSLIVAFLLMLSSVPLEALAPSHQVKSLEGSSLYLDISMPVQGGEDGIAERGYGAVLTIEDDRDERGGEAVLTIEDDRDERGGEAVLTIEDDRDERGGEAVLTIEDIMENIQHVIEDEEDDATRRIQTIEALLVTAYVGYVILSSPWGLPFYILTLFFKSYVDAHPNHWVSKIYNYLFVYPVKVLPLLIEGLLIYFQRKFPSIQIPHGRIVHLVFYKVMIFSVAFFLYPQFFSSVRWVGGGYEFSSFMGRSSGRWSGGTDALWR